MGDTSIEWTDKTWNPTRGCSRVSPGCVNCYAERQARRFTGDGKPYEGLLHSSGAWNGRITLVEGALDMPMRWRKPSRIFVDSMSDLFHEEVPFEFVDKVFAVMARARHHTFQVLTKRAGRMRDYFASRDSHIRVLEASHSVALCAMEWCQWPLPNVWLGVSVEDQLRADERIPLLLDSPAAVRFLSCEPLLSAVDLSFWLGVRWVKTVAEFQVASSGGRTGLSWVIVGGESGPGARPFVIEHGERIVRQCRARRVPVFVKQLGALPVHREAALVHPISDRKGAVMDEWPEGLRVREFPA